MISWRLRIIIALVSLGVAAFVVLGNQYLQFLGWSPWTARVAATMAVFGGLVVFVIVMSLRDGARKPKGGPR